jgi:flagellar biosynthesis/type III secretory pathway chaperone
MTAPETTVDRSPLEAALIDVQTTLADLLVAADEQYAAIVERDRERLESVTRQQERLSARLANAEARRVAVLGGLSLNEAVKGQPRLAALADSIGNAVRLLKTKQTQTASLLQQSIELTDQTLKFLHRLVTPPATVYGTRGLAVARQSVLVDSRA